MALPEGIPDERKAQGGGGGGGGSKVPARGSSTVQADLTCGKREREGSPVTKKCEHGGLRQGHDFSNADRTPEQLRRECNTRKQGHQGNYFTNSPWLATVC